MSKEHLHTFQFEYNDFTSEINITNFNTTQEPKLKQLQEKSIKILERIKTFSDKDTRRIIKSLKSDLSNSRPINKKLHAVDQLFVLIEQIVKMNENLQKCEKKINIDYPQMFPNARNKKRNVTIIVGPTNSGKTYEALSILKQSKNGCYLAPLRLLALEIYDEFMSEGLQCSMLTGEEQFITPNANYESMTIELLDPHKEYETVVIDECQMLSDTSRGFAWTKAICGSNATNIVSICAPEGLDAVERLFKLCGEDATVIRKERKNELEIIEPAFGFHELKKGDAVVCFSVKDVYALQEELKNGYDLSSSLVYGSLPPKLRIKEANDFVNGLTDILIATDAIGMGLNLPIKRLFFYKTEKFDGNGVRELTHAEILQIAGRAGRYSFSEKGYVGAFDEESLVKIKGAFYEPIFNPIDTFYVSPMFEHIKFIADETQSNLTQTFIIWKDFFDNSSHFSSQRIEEVVYRANILSKYKLDLHTAFTLAMMPSNEILSNEKEEFWFKIVSTHISEKSPYKVSLPSNKEERKVYEFWYNRYGNYMWLARKFDNFGDPELFYELREEMSEKIFNLLREIKR